ncbi:MAG: hypothetical protein GY696_30430 [Gammaproteobacteria bacterium]|nr:hypothetical protein [Gammaproteobacteria bacterium]
MGLNTGLNQIASMLVPDSPFVWGVGEKKEFDQFKRAINTLPLLWNEEPTSIYHLMCWHDDKLIFAHLRGYDPDGKKVFDTRRIRNLTQAELQYPSPQIELLNVAWAVKEFADRLLPAFTVVLTHHWVLATYFSYRQTDSRVARWLVYLKPYRLIFKARPTKDSEVSRVMDDHLPTISCNVRMTDNNPRYNSQSSDSVMPVTG